MSKFFDVEGSDPKQTDARDARRATETVAGLYPPSRPMPRLNVLPTNAAERNEYPMADGLLYYFPAALAAVARVSKIGNDQHNPGEPMHHARAKSGDHANKIMKHLVDAGLMDTDGTRHSAKLAWRALALLQEELEREEGAPIARNAR